MIRALPPPSVLLLLLAVFAPGSAWSPVGAQEPSGVATVCVVEASGSESTLTVPAAEARTLLTEGPALPGPCALYGPAALLGSGSLRAYVQIDDARRPLALGIVLPAGALRDLPSAPNDGFRCLDLDEDGDVDLAHECVGGHERVLFLPTVWEDEVPSPFSWALFNWNPKGHGPAGIWDVPHFDFHFFIQPLSERNEIRIGKCAMLVDCDDLAVGSRPVPPEYLPAGYEDRGVVEFGMGNHLIDPRTFGTRDVRPTHTFIYGAWAGKISFFEPMVTLAYLESVKGGAAPSSCFPIPQPSAWEQDTFYPTRYCIRYRSLRSEFVVSLEGFVQRARSQAGEP